MSFFRRLRHHAACEISHVIAVNGQVIVVSRALGDPAHQLIQHIKGSSNAHFARQHSHHGLDVREGKVAVVLPEVSFEC